MTLDDLRDKKIALVGLGREGMSTLRFLLSKGIKPVAALDQKLPENTVGEFLKQSKVELLTGSGYLENLNGYDVLFRSPGVPRLHPKLLSFPIQENVYSLTKLFFDLCPAKIVGITGTKGKTTTSTLIHEIIKKSGGYSLLGGNVGEPALNLLDNLTPDAIAVLEMSSFQLQDLNKSPNIAVVLNVTHDHIDDKHSFKPATHDSYDEYMAAKQQILAHQTPEDFAVLSDALPEEWAKIGPAKKIIARAVDGAIYKSKLVGRHNNANISAAAAVAKLLGINQADLRDAIEDFEPVSHRLKIVSVNEGVTYVDDSASTDVDSSIAAIDSFDSNIVLILGGSDKSLDYNPLGEKIKSEGKVKAVVVVGQVTERILAALGGYKGKVLTGAKSMSEIVEQAKSAAESGDIILLSPAAASFDMFKDAKDRGDQFIKFVR